MIYDFVVQYIGTLPIHLSIIYDIVTLFIVILIPICLIFPVYMFIGKHNKRGLL